MSAAQAVGLLLAGAAGAVARATLTAGLRRVCTSATATGIVNVAGAATLGVVLGLGDTLGEAATRTIAVGFLGAFTTFSTWMHDAADTWRSGRRAAAALQAAALLAAGVAATAALRAVVAAGMR